MKRSVLYLLLLVGCFVACGRNKEKSAQKEEKLVVFAAASLTDVFSKMAVQFEKEYPNIKVVVSYAGSQSLRTQIQNGATPDVFASANKMHVRDLTEKGLLKPATIFAKNKMVLVVSKQKAHLVKDFSDLANLHRIVLAGRAVPAGRYSEKILRKAHNKYGKAFSETVLSQVVSRELNVRQTLQKVILGEADAALVYTTDVLSHKQAVAIIVVPSQLNVEVFYPIATLREARSPKAAQKFVGFITSKDGEKILEEFGFLIAH